MSGRGIAALAVIMVALLATLAIELNRDILDSESMIAAPRIASPNSADPKQAPAAHRADDWVATILARPLFSPDRRAPVHEAPAPVAAPQILPRLTGVLVSSTGKTAFFAGEAGGKPIAVREGGRIADFTVQVIEAGQVTIAGPAGSKVLRPFEQAKHPAGKDVPAAARVQTAGETAP